MTVTVEIYKKRTPIDNYEEHEPDETHELDYGESFVWKDDVYFMSGPLGFYIPPEDRPATLNVYTNDSVHTPNEWGTPIERGLTWYSGIPEDDDRPFGCEVWGRVLIEVEELDE